MSNEATTTRCPHCNAQQFHNPAADPRLASMSNLCWKCVKPLDGK